jgi:hypothetical protein
MTDVPLDFLRISCAVNRLADGMFGGLRRPDPVTAIKQDQKKLSVGFGPWREKAARYFRTAAEKGKLTIYVLAKRQTRSEVDNSTEQSTKGLEPVVVPVPVIKRLIASRGGLPDQPIQPSIKTADGDEKLFALLIDGLLIVRACDFEGWYQTEYAKGRWPSQRSKSAKNGRPSKQTEALRNAVLALVHDRKWNGKDPIAALHRLLVASGRSNIPSPDTLAHLVNNLHRETGEAGLLRITRMRRKRTGLI